MRAGEMLAAIRALPVGELPAGGVLVLAPHQDDESLGCGGLVGRLCDAGRPPAIVFVTDGSRSHTGSAAFPPERLRMVRADEALRAVAILGVVAERVRFLALPDGEAPVSGPEFEEAVTTIRRLAASFGCETIAAPWRHDPHCDHEAAALMARASGLHVLSYPVWGWLLPPDTELGDVVAPSGWRLPVESVLERKRQAIAAHASQTGRLINDDPEGFSLPTALTDACVTPFEFFLEDAR